MELALLDAFLRSSWPDLDPLLTGLAFFLLTMLSRLVHRPGCCHHHILQQQQQQQ